MIRRVLKYPLSMSASAQALGMPVGAKIVHVAEQHDVPTMWAEVETPDDTAAAFETRYFILRGTGDDIPPEFNDHRGTVFIGAFVFHVYEAISARQHH